MEESFDDQLLFKVRREQVENEGDLMSVCTHFSTRVNVTDTMIGTT